MYNTLYIRVRRASEKKRRTQIQLPLALVRSSYFANVNRLINETDGHQIVRAHARGRLNTVKVEIPEIANMIEPVLKITKGAVTGNLYYEAFEFNSREGIAIRDSLQSGFRNGTTRQTLRRALREFATWFQFVTPNGVPVVPGGM